jgi:hypothetical protein
MQHAVEGLLRQPQNLLSKIVRVRPLKTPVDRTRSLVNSGRTAVSTDF